MKSLMSKLANEDEDSDARRQGKKTLTLTAGLKQIHYTQNDTKGKTMKRRIALTIVLAVSVMSLSLVGLDSTARAQQPSRFKGDTGIASLGSNQILRLTVALGDTATHEARVTFRKVEYAPNLCNNEGVCRQVVASQTTTTPISLAAGEAASIDIAGHAGGAGVRGFVLCNNENVKVTAQLIDVATGVSYSVTVLDNE